MRAERPHRHAEGISSGSRLRILGAPGRLKTARSLGRSRFWPLDYNSVFLDPARNRSKVVRFIAPYTAPGLCAEFMLRMVRRNHRLPIWVKDIAPAFISLH